MATSLKYIEMIDKENSKVGIPSVKKDKSNAEDPYVKKTVLGEVSQPQILPNEPSSPEDTKLLERKRKMGKQSVEGFAFQLSFC
jgi:hypothetical protein